MFRRQSTSDGTDNDLIIIGVLLGAGVGFEPSTRASFRSRLGFAVAGESGEDGGVCGLSSGEAGLARQALRAVHRTFVSA